MTAVRRLLIDGKQVESERTYPTLNPARRAFDTTIWPNGLALRIRCLEQLYQALTEHQEELRELAIAEAGTTRTALSRQLQSSPPHASHRRPLFR